MRLSKILQGTLFNIDIEGESQYIIEANDILNFRYGLSSKTYTIKILNTPNNNKILDNIFYNNYTKKTITSVVLHLENMQILGRLIILNNNTNYIEVQFVSNAGEIWDSIGDKKISDFDWSKYNHTLTFFQTNGLMFNGDIIYDFVRRGIDSNDLKFPMYFTSPNLLADLKDENVLKWSTNTPVNYEHIGNATGIDYHISGFPTYSVNLYSINNDMSNRLPTIKLKALLEGIFEGYNIHQNVWTESDYNKIYVLHSNTKLRQEVIEDKLPKIQQVSKKTRMQFNEAYVKEDYNISNYPFSNGTWHNIRIYNSFLQNSDLDGTNITKFNNGYKVTFDSDGAYRINMYLKTQLDMAINIVNQGFLSATLYPKNIRFKFYIKHYSKYNQLIRTIYANRSGRYEYVEDIFTVKLAIDTGYFDIANDEYITMESYVDVDIPDASSTQTYLNTDANNNQTNYIDYQIKNYTSYGNRYNVNWYNEPFDYVPHTTIQKYTPNTSDTIETVGELLTITYKKGYGYYGDVDGSWCVPSKTVKDFIGGLLANFNIDFFVDNKNNIYLENYQRETVTKSYDITNYIIKDSIESSDFNVDTNFNLAYTNDELDIDYDGEVTKDIKIPFKTYDSSSNGFLLDGSAKEVDIIQDYHIKYTASGRVIKPLTIDKAIEYNYSTDIALVYLDNFSYSLEYRYTGNDVDRGYSIKTINIPKLVPFTLDSIYTDYFKETLDLYQDSFKLKCTLNLGNDFINNLINFSANDLRDRYFINIDGYKGYYKINRLTYKEDGIYEGEFVRIDDVNYGEPVLEGNSFNANFTNDFDNENVPVPSGDYYFAYVYLPSGYTNINDIISVQGAGSKLEGSTVTLLATMLDPNYTFNGWYIDNVLVSSDLNYTFIMPSSDVFIYTKIDEIILPDYTLTVTPNNSDVSTSGSGVYEVGESVTVTATILNNDYVFSYWKNADTNAILSSSIQYTFNMPDNDLNIEAVIKPSNALGNL